MIFHIAGRQFEIDRDSILSATERLRPNPTDRRHRHYVELHGKKFPIKQPIHEETSLPYIEFQAQQAHRILVNLGFDVHQWPQPASAPSAETRTTEATAKFAVSFETDEDGYFVASCPALPGCHSQGRTRQEATSNIREAIKGYIASMRKHGEPIPTADVAVIEVAI
jgi:predicted RNase H-like HicB family nuclease